MKRALPLFCGMAAGALAMAFGLASCASNPSRPAPVVFARPGPLPAAEAGPVLDLTRPDTFTSRRALNRLADDPAVCEASLAAAGVRFTALPERTTPEGCGYSSGVTLDRSIAMYSTTMVGSCELMARLHMWERHVVIPAAEAHFGQPVTLIESFGAYSCRRVAGIPRLSQHAFGQAADIAGFVLADGRRIRVEDHYRSDGPEGDFLRAVRRGACEGFDVTLGPDYNAAHRDHFHLDVGRQKLCR